MVKIRESFVTDLKHSVVYAELSYMLGSALVILKVASGASLACPCLLLWTRQWTLRSNLLILFTSTFKDVNFPFLIRFCLSLSPLSLSSPCFEVNYFLLSR